MSSSSSSVTPPKTCNDITVAVEKATESQVVSPPSSSPSKEMAMEDQVVSSSGSSAPQPEKSNEITVSVEESRNNNPGLGFERRSENPSVRSGAVPTRNEFMQLYPPRSNKIFTCPLCKKGFSTSQALGGHQNAHKLEREWERKRKDMEREYPGFAFLNPYVDDPHMFWLGGYSEDALSNENHLGIPTESLKRRFNGNFPYFNNGFSDMDITMVPRIHPTRFFTGNTFTYGSSSGGLGPRPPYNKYPPILPRNVPLRTTNNLPSGFYPQENVLNEEDVILKLRNDHNIVEIDDDDDDVATDPPEEGTPKSWGADLSL